jgi:hypothetical protein
MEDTPEPRSDGIPEQSPGNSAARTTIVGGRPPAPSRQQEAIPRGIEVLVKKAAVDPAFRTLLLERRAAAAHEIALELSPAEAAAINAVPQPQLEQIIANARVTDMQRRAFLGQVGAAMLAALTLGLTGCETASPTPPSPTRGITGEVVTVPPGRTIAGIMPTYPPTATGEPTEALPTATKAPAGIRPQDTPTPTPELPRRATPAGIIPTYTPVVKPTGSPIATATPVPVELQRLDVNVDGEGPDWASLVVRYDCRFDEGGSIRVYFRQSSEAQGAMVTTVPSFASVATGSGEVRFRASGRGGTTNWIMAGLSNLSNQCKPYPSPPSELTPGRYSEDACVIWKTVQYHKDWP